MSDKLKKWIMANLMGFGGMKEMPLNWDMCRYVFIKIDGIQYMVDGNDKNYPEWVVVELEGRT